MKPLPGDLVEILWHGYDAFRGWTTTPVRALVERMHSNGYGTARTFDDDGRESVGCDFYIRDGKLHHGGRS